MSTNFRLTRAPLAKAAMLICILFICPLFMLSQKTDTTNSSSFKADVPRPAATLTVKQIQVPQPARKEFEKAYASVRKEDEAGARAHVTRALKLYPEFAEALVLLALLDSYDGDKVSAITHAEAAVKCDPNLGAAYTALIRVYNDAGKFKEAEAYLSRTLSRDSGVRAYYEVARTEAGLGKFAGAMQHLENAERLGVGEYPGVYLLKAFVLLRLGKPEAAYSSLKIFGDMDPEGINLPVAKKVDSEIRSALALARGRGTASIPQD